MRYRDLQRLQRKVDALERLMTTDPEEGQKQAEQSNNPENFAKGDRVRLKAGGPVMTVLAVEDYGNKIVCERREPPNEASQETHSAASLEHESRAATKEAARHTEQQQSGGAVDAGGGDSQRSD